ncbi:hypothetical protein LUQ84_001423 [Hamiltosporidium tvaerminnensis]|nr:hypothetical protein LUQ84_001423 [Hamiltosporidium tvaerminnensis]
MKIVSENVMILLNMVLYLKKCLLTSEHRKINTCDVLQHYKRQGCHNKNRKSTYWKRFYLKKENPTVLLYPFVECNEAINYFDSESREIFFVPMLVMENLSNNEKAIRMLSIEEYKKYCKNNTIISFSFKALNDNISPDYEPYCMSETEVSDTKESLNLSQIQSENEVRSELIPEENADISLGNSFFRASAALEKRFLNIDTTYEEHFYNSSEIKAKQTNTVTIAKEIDINSVIVEFDRSCKIKYLVMIKNGCGVNDPMDQSNANPMTTDLKKDNQFEDLVIPFKKLTLQDHLSRSENPVSINESKKILSENQLPCSPKQDSRSYDLQNSHDLDDDFVSDEKISTHVNESNNIIFAAKYLGKDQNEDETSYLGLRNVSSIESSVYKNANGTTNDIKIYPERQSLLNSSKSDPEKSDVLKPAIQAMDTGEIEFRHHSHRNIASVGRIVGASVSQKPSDSKKRKNLVLFKSLYESEDTSSD